MHGKPVAALDGLPAVLVVGSLLRGIHTVGKDIGLMSALT